jgi:5-methylcytosine-specific restriction protein B
MEEFKRELDLIIDQYEEVVGDPAELEMAPPELRLDLGEASRSFAQALKTAFVDFGLSHDNLVVAFLSSIVTKPLIILTGLSGSGKTQLALKLGEWLGEGRLHVAAVRPDWTGAEALFGYEDGLKPALEGRSGWVVTAPLEFMLQAAADGNHPYLLLLDEMNLAHVERYFADVLSGMESGQPCLPNLVKGADGVWRVRPQGPDRMSFPRNLWIVGTVNVDETTYMFSPKVLDRANTFEFRVDARDLRPDIQKPGRCLPGDQALVRGLLAIARDDAWQQVHPAPYRDELGQKLRQLHVALAQHGMEFGHRVFYESLRFAAMAHAAGFATLEPVLDHIIMQKVLPRLHGSRRRLELPLLLLTQFCRDLPEALASDDSLPSLRLEQPGHSDAKLPVSFNKLCRMLRSLRSNQFASFTE